MSFNAVCSANFSRHRWRTRVRFNNNNNSHFQFPSQPNGNFESFREREFYLFDLKMFVPCHVCRHSLQRLNLKAFQCMTQTHKVLRVRYIQCGIEKFVRIKTECPTNETFWLKFLSGKWRGKFAGIFFPRKSVQRSS